MPGMWMMTTHNDLCSLWIHARLLQTGDHPSCLRTWLLQIADRPSSLRTQGSIAMSGNKE
ncbi:hypothetical protein GF406_08570 [candidate division KSB1 bacterium]|nr:hypothetical protein [candidate division KSB1 bacterium]